MVFSDKTVLMPKESISSINRTCSLIIYDVYKPMLEIAPCGIRHRYIMHIHIIYYMYLYI